MGQQYQYVHKVQACLSCAVFPNLVHKPWQIPVL